MFLKVLDGPHEGRVFDCSKGPLRIGRRMPPSQVLTTDSHDVSRGAVQIERDGGRYVVWDFSENGIFVNGDLLHGGSVELAVGDEILIGKTRMALLAEAVEEKGVSLGSVDVDTVKLDQLAQLFPRMDPRSVVDFLLDQELYRRGLLDETTGAGHISSFLRAVPRTPLGKHGFGFTPRGLDGEVERWMIAADVRGLLQVNDRAGMKAGDEVLLILSAAFRFSVPNAYCFRIHGDAFVAISDQPMEFQKVRAEILKRFEEGLSWAASEPLCASKIDLTFASLHVTVVNPHSPIVLGPLFLAEIERALLVSRLVSDEGKEAKVQDRTIRLDGFVAE